jgi:hypothetical protein
MTLGAVPHADRAPRAIGVFVLVGTGVCIGAGVSTWGSKPISTLLYRLEPRDPGTLIGAAFVLIIVAPCAAGLPV